MTHHRSQRIRSDFGEDLVPVESDESPEELIESLSGGCNKWQISVCIISFTAEIIHGVNIFSSLVVAPPKVNYTCKNGNGSRCFNVNGSKCQEFVFYKDYKNFETYTEKFLLVCDKEWLGTWIDNSFQLGLMVSYLLAGWTADRFGRKVAAMVFIPLQCICGSIMITCKTYATVLCLKFLHGLFSAAINLLPLIIVSDITGNRWRTFALGFSSYALPISFMVEIIVFSRGALKLGALEALNAFLPLTLLPPLLYFKNSPLYTFYKTDFEKGEEILRRIARFNNVLIKPDMKVIPAELMMGDPKREVFIDYWKVYETRYPLLALMALNFLRGLSFSILVIYFMKHIKMTLSVALVGTGALLGSIITVALCHLIPHKVLICIFAFLKNYLIFAVLISDPSLVTRTRFIILMFLSVSFYSSFNTSLENITPRMFPTGLRSQGVGLCLCLFHAGTFLTNILYMIPQEAIILWISAITLVIVCPAFETLSSLYLWKVHNRELPDFIKDCINFKKYYKPARYIGINNENPSLSEFEIRLVDFSENN